MEAFAESHPTLVENDLELPLGETTEGTLVWTSGASHLGLVADPTLPHLLRASFRGLRPRVRLEHGKVTMRYDLGFGDWLKQILLGGSFGADVVLNGTLPWRLLCRGGAASVHADLRFTRVLEISITGGASEVDLRLPRPVGVVPVRIMGGASHVRVTRPSGVPVRVAVSGGASVLELDDQRFGAVGGGLRLGCADGPDRYDIEVTGGASHLSVMSEFAA